MVIRLSCVLVIVAIGSTPLAAQPPVVGSEAAVDREAPLASWNDGPAKRSIIEFVEGVCREGSATYVTPSERIATFDNDGCLWAEQPVYFQLLFAIERVRERAGDHPEWRTTEPYRSAIAGDFDQLRESGHAGLEKIIAASHTDQTSTEFAGAVRQWLRRARHPRTDRLYTEMVYQPMLELLDYLRAREFKTFIVSGGGIDFIRVFAEEAYGIPPEQVVGSSVAARYEMRDGVPTIVKIREGLFINDKAGKPVGIYQHIGRRPIFAAGNSDGDLQMLQYTTLPREAAPRHRGFGLLIHHTDAEREWAYDRESQVGRLDQALDAAAAAGWTVVDMQRDWARVFPEVE
jgi:phosphoglycolate phosphatase-like HAD superfamily hydrolase